MQADVALAANLNNSIVKQFWAKVKCVHKNFVVAATDIDKAIEASLNSSGRRGFCFHGEADSASS